VQDGCFFFINFLAHIAFGIVMGLGIPSTAGGGLFLMFKMYANDQTLAGMFCLICMILWLINVLISVYLLKSAHRVWKHSGIPEATRKEAVTAVAAEAAQAA